jgi:hypothetical protein
LVIEQHRSSTSQHHHLQNPRWNRRKNDPVDDANPANVGVQIPGTLGSRLEFGARVDGYSQVIVTVDLFGTQLFYYDSVEKYYYALPQTWLWKYRLSGCTNSDALVQIAVGGLPIRQYLELGLDNVGYLDTVWQRPHLAEYLDNPGLFILLMVSPDSQLPLVYRQLSRAQLVEKIPGITGVTRAHVKWLAKIRPNNDSPLHIFRYIRKIFAGATVFQWQDSARVADKHDRKVFHHQSVWTCDGLRLLSMLLTDRRASLSELAWLIRAHNGVEDPNIVVAAKLLKRVAVDTQFPQMLRERARSLAANRELLCPMLAKNSPPPR